MPHRPPRSALGLLGALVTLSAGCPSTPDAPIDASPPLDASPSLDAGPTLDAREALDAPRRLDAFEYDSGARCELPGPPDAGAIERCNGHAALCDRRYDEVAFLTTHNAMSSEEDGFRSPNQRYRAPLLHPWVG